MWIALSLAAVAFVGAVIVGITLTNRGSKPNRALQVTATATVPSAPGFSLPSLPTSSFSLPSVASLASCTGQSLHFTVAYYYVLGAQLGLLGQAQSRVYRDSVPRTVTERLRGTTYSPNLTDTTGGNGQGTTAKYQFTATGSAATVTVTTTREPDGKIWVTAVQLG
jgi:hypothetical protein